MKTDENYVMSSFYQVDPTDTLEKVSFILEEELHALADQKGMMPDPNNPLFHMGAIKDEEGWTAQGQMLVVPKA